jgi:hypothetical protein
MSTTEDLRNQNADSAGNPAVAGAVVKVQSNPALDDNLPAALARVQAQLPKIEKGKTATVTMKAGGSYSYKYADLADAVEKTYPLLATHGLSFSASPTLNAARFVLAYALLHASGEERSGEYPLPDPTSARPQDIGSAITYARRYSFCAVTGLVTEEDDDGNLAQQAHSSRPSGGKPKAKTSARQSQPQPTRTVDSETGEIQEPPNVQAAIEKLDQEGRKKLLDKMEAAHPPVDNLPTAAARQVIKWAGEIAQAS